MVPTINALTLDERASEYLRLKKVNGQLIRQPSPDRSRLRLRLDLPTPLVSSSQVATQPFQQYIRPEGGFTNTGRPGNWAVNAK
jgi:hypothetical protein